MEIFLEMEGFSEMYGPETENLNPFLNEQFLKLLI